MSTVLDLLSSPLKGYVTQTLQFYLSKYIEGVHLDGLGVFGEDIVLHDLELKKDVLQSSLDIPPRFDFTRGFIRELRILIPWTKLLSQPIEIKLNTIELILTSQSRGRSSRTARRTGAHHSTNPHPNESHQKSWRFESIHKILANVTIQITNLVVKYVQEGVTLSLTLGALDIYSAHGSAEGKWDTRQFSSPIGGHDDDDDEMIAKTIKVTDISLFLNQSKHTSSGYAVPILNRCSISARLKFALTSEPSNANRRADVMTDEHRRVEMTASDDESDPALDPLDDLYRRLPNVLSSPFTWTNSEKTNHLMSRVRSCLDIQLYRLHFVLSNRHMEILSNFVSAFSQVYATQEEEEEEDLMQPQNQNGISQSFTTIRATDASQSSWMGWALNSFTVDDTHDDLVSELIAESEQAAKTDASHSDICPILENIQLCIEQASIVLSMHLSDDQPARPILALETHQWFLHVQHIQQNEAQGRDVQLEIGKVELIHHHHEQFLPRSLSSMNDRLTRPPAQLISWGTILDPEDMQTIVAVHPYAQRTLFSSSEDHDVVWNSCNQCFVKTPPALGPQEDHRYEKNLPQQIWLTFIKSDWNQFEEALAKHMMINPSMSLGSQHEFKKLIAKYFHSSARTPDDFQLSLDKFQKHWAWFSTTGDSNEFCQWPMLLHERSIISRTHSSALRLRIIFIKQDQDDDPSAHLSIDIALGKLQGRYSNAFADDLKLILNPLSSLSCVAKPIEKNGAEEESQFFWWLHHPNLDLHSLVTVDRIQGWIPSVAVTSPSIDREKYWNLIDVGPMAISVENSIKATKTNDESERLLFHFELPRLQILQWNEMQHSVVVVVGEINHLVLYYAAVSSENLEFVIGVDELSCGDVQRFMSLLFPSTSSAKRTIDARIATTGCISIHAQSIGCQIEINANEQRPATIFCSGSLNQFGIQAGSTSTILETIKSPQQVEQAQPWFELGCRFQILYPSPLHNIFMVLNQNLDKVAVDFIDSTLGSYAIKLHPLMKIIHSIEEWAPLSSQPMSLEKEDQVLNTSPLESMTKRRVMHVRINIKPSFLWLSAYLAVSLPQCNIILSSSKSSLENPFIIQLNLSKWEVQLASLPYQLSSLSSQLNGGIVLISPCVIRLECINDQVLNMSTSINKISCALSKFKCRMIHSALNSLPQQTLASAPTASAAVATDRVGSTSSRLKIQMYLSIDSIILDIDTKHFHSYQDLFQQAWPHFLQLHFHLIQCQFKKDDDHSDDYLLYLQDVDILEEAYINTESDPKSKTESNFQWCRLPLIAVESVLSYLDENDGGSLDSLVTDFTPTKRPLCSIPLCATNIGDQRQQNSQVCFLVLHYQENQILECTMTDVDVIITPVTVFAFLSTFCFESSQAATDFGAADDFSSAAATKDDDAALVPEISCRLGLIRVISPIYSLSWYKCIQQLHDQPKNHAPNNRMFILSLPECHWISSTTHPENNHISGQCFMTMEVWYPVTKNPDDVSLTTTSSPLQKALHNQSKLNIHTMVESTICAPFDMSLTLENTSTDPRKTRFLRQMQWTFECTSIQLEVKDSIFALLLNFNATIDKLETISRKTEFHQIVFQGPMMECPTNIFVRFPNIGIKWKTSQKQQIELNVDQMQFYHDCRVQNGRFTISSINLQSTRNQECVDVFEKLVTTPNQSMHQGEHQGEQEYLILISWILISSAEDSLSENWVIQIHVGSWKSTVTTHVIIPLMLNVQHIQSVAVVSQIMDSMKLRNHSQDCIGSLPIPTVLSTKTLMSLKLFMTPGTFQFSDIILSFNQVFGNVKIGSVGNNLMVPSNSNKIAEENEFHRYFIFSTLDFNAKVQQLKIGLTSNSGQTLKTLLYPIHVNVCGQQSHIVKMLSRHRMISGIDPVITQMSIEIEDGWKWVISKDIIGYFLRLGAELKQPGESNLTSNSSAEAVNYSNQKNSSTPASMLEDFLFFTLQMEDMVTSQQNAAATHLQHNHLMLFHTLLSNQNVENTKDTAQHFVDQREVSDILQILNGNWRKNHDSVSDAAPGDVRYIHREDSPAHSHWMRIQWKYTVPRQLISIHCRPFPIPSTGLLPGWPVVYGEELAAKEGGWKNHDLCYYCDFECELWYYHPITRQWKYFMKFYIPIEHTEDDIKAIEEMMEQQWSFASILNSWIIDEHQGEEGELLQSPYFNKSRKICFQKLNEKVASDCWEMRWKIPSETVDLGKSHDRASPSFNADIEQRLILSNALLSCLQIESKLAINAVPYLNIQCSIPTTECCFHDDTEAEMAKLNVGEFQLLHLESKQHRRSQLILKELSLSRFDYINLSEFIILEPIKGQIDFQYFFNPTRGKRDQAFNCNIEDTVVINTSQSTILFLAQLDQLLVDHDHQNAMVLPRMRIQNFCSQPLYVRQYQIQRDQYLLGPEQEMDYSWYCPNDGTDGNQHFHSCLEISATRHFKAPQVMILKTTDIGMYAWKYEQRWVSVEYHGLGTLVCIRPQYVFHNHTSFGMEIQSSAFKSPVMYLPPVTQDSPFSMEQELDQRCTPPMYPQVISKYWDYDPISSTSRANWSTCTTQKETFLDLQFRISLDSLPGGQSQWAGVKIFKFVDESKKENGPGMTKELIWIENEKLQRFYFWIICHHVQCVSSVQFQHVQQALNYDISSTSESQYQNHPTLSIQDIPALFFEPHRHTCWIAVEIFGTGEVWNHLPFSIGVAVLNEAGETNQQQQELIANHGERMVTYSDPSQSHFSMSLQLSGAASTSELVVLRNDSPSTDKALKEKEDHTEKNHMSTTPWNQQFFVNRKHTYLISWKRSSLFHHIQIQSEYHVRNESSCVLWIKMLNEEKTLYTRAEPVPALESKSSLVLEQTSAATLTLVQFGIEMPDDIWWSNPMEKCWMDKNGGTTSKKVLIQQPAHQDRQDQHDDYIRVAAIEFLLEWSPMNVHSQHRYDSPELVFRPRLKLINDSQHTLAVRWTDGKGQLTTSMTQKITAKEDDKNTLLVVGWITRQNMRHQVERKPTLSRSPSAFVSAIFRASFSSASEESIPEVEDCTSKSTKVQGMGMTLSFDDHGVDYSWSGQIQYSREELNRSKDCNRQCIFIPASSSSKDECHLVMLCMSLEFLPSTNQVLVIIAPNLEPPIRMNNQTPDPIEFRWLDPDDSVRDKSVVNYALPSHTEIEMDYISIVSTTAVDQEATTIAMTEIQRMNHFHRSTAQDKNVFDTTIRDDHTQVCPPSFWLRRHDDATGWTRPLVFQLGLQFVTFPQKQQAKEEHTVVVHIYPIAGCIRMKIQALGDSSHDIPHQQLMMETTIRLHVPALVIGFYDESTSCPLPLEDAESEAFCLGLRQMYQFRLDQVALDWQQANTPTQCHDKELRREFQLGHLDCIDQFQTLNLCISGFQLEQYIPSCAQYPILISCPSPLTLNLEILTPHAFPPYVYHGSLKFESPLEFECAEDSIYASLFRFKPFIDRLVGLTSSANPRATTNGSKILTAQRRLLYIQHLSIHPLTFITTLRLTSVIGFYRTPIHLAQVDIHDQSLLTPLSTFVTELAANYVADFVLSSPMLLASLEALGNPAGFLRSVRLGLVDFFTLSWTTTTTTQQEHSTDKEQHVVDERHPSFVTGISAGSRSFVRHLSEGTLTSLSGLSFTLARILNPPSSLESCSDTCSMLEQDQTTTTTRAGPESKVALGLSELRHSLDTALLEIVHSYPFHKRSSGSSIRQRVAGLGRGLVGAVARPAGGLVGLVAHTSEGLLVQSHHRRASRRRHHPVEWMRCRLHLDIWLGQKVIQRVMRVPPERVVVEQDKRSLYLITASHTWYLVSLDNHTRASEIVLEAEFHQLHTLEIEPRDSRRCTLEIVTDPSSSRSGQNEIQSWNLVATSRHFWKDWWQSCVVLKSDDK